MKLLKIFLLFIIPAFSSAIKCHQCLHSTNQDTTPGQKITNDIDCRDAKDTYLMECLNDTIAWELDVKFRAGLPSVEEYLLGGDFSSTIENGEKDSLKCLTIAMETNDGSGDFSFRGCTSKNIANFCQITSGEITGNTKLCVCDTDGCNAQKMDNFHSKSSSTILSAPILTATALCLFNIWN